MKVEPYIKQDKQSWQGNLFWIGVNIITDNGLKQHFSEYVTKRAAEEFAIKFGIEMPKEG